MSIWNLQSEIENAVSHLEAYSSKVLLNKDLKMPYVEVNRPLYIMLYDHPQYGYIAEDAGSYYENGSPVDKLHSSFDMLVLL